MTFKLTYDEIKSLQQCNSHIGGDPHTTEKLRTILAWMETMPMEDRYVYLLGRKT